MTVLDADVVIVGYGPVGQLSAALLARRGHRVLVYERYAELFGLPRALYFDDGAMRVWQALGIVDELADDLLPATRYDWFGADGEAIVRMEFPSPGVSGWEPGYLFYQPYLEQALDRVVRALPAAAVHRGWSAEGLAQADDHVALTLRRVREPRLGRLEPTAETTTVRARYVIGADGANSFVRDAVGMVFEDHGFAEQWLVVDLRPDDLDGLGYLEAPCQWCDPARPHMQSRTGRSHHRFEFMLLPGERPEDFEDEASVWPLLARWMRPGAGAIVRHAVYEFRARLAQSMRAGRALLAGDAAHTMPPFMAQGLGSGIRDAAALAWRLDLILRGLADDRLLDSYAAERRAQNAWIVNLSAEMGRVSCVLDAQAAADRDATLRALAAPPPAPELAPLQHGAVAEGALLAGTRAVQGTVRYGGREGRFDDVVGRGFVLLTRRRAALPAEQTRFLERIGAVVVAIDDLEDLDGRLTAWLREHAVEAVVSRPDFYVFGAVRALDELPALVDALRAQLSTTEEGSPMSTDAPVIHPKFHHVNLKTVRLQEMIDWYSTLVGAEVLYQYELGAWISNDDANHRIALLAFPNFVEDPEKDTRAGLHHTAFEYESFEELNASYLRLKAAGIVPDFCLDHGMTFSYYYRDPDGNHVELQVDNFGDWSQSSAWMRESLQFHEDPLGKFVDPDRVAAAYAAGTSFEEIHARAMAGQLAPDANPVDLPQVEA